MIHILMLYEKVTLTMPMEQRRFFSCLNDTIAELRAKYEQPKPKLLFCDEDENNRCDEILTYFYTSLEEYIPIHYLYANCIVDNILFLAGAGEEYKTEFLRKADEAYRSCLRSKAKRTGRIKRGSW